MEIYKYLKYYQLDICNLIAIKKFNIILNLKVTKFLL